MFWKMDTQLMISLVILGGAFIFSLVGYVYRKVQSESGETFDWDKFARTLGYGVLLALAAYISTGTVPELTTIFTQIEAGIPESQALITLGATVIFGLINQYILKPKTTATATAAAAITAPKEEEKWSVGFTVTPAFNAGLSPFAANLQAVVGMNSDAKTRATLQVDWQDGSPVETAKVEEKTGIAPLSHTYTYVKGDSKYTGKSFYPLFRVVQADGTVQEFNTATTGRCCEIEVQSQ